MIFNEIIINGKVLIISKLLCFEETVEEFVVGNFQLYKIKPIGNPQALVYTDDGENVFQFMLLIGW